MLHGGVQRCAERPAHPRYLNDLYLFRVEGCAWVRVRAEAAGLPPRADFSLAVSSNGLLIFGGRNEHNLLDGALTLLALPPARAEQLAALLGRAAP